MTNQQASPPAPPVQRKDYDLSAGRNGVAKPENAPPAIRAHADERTPEGMMRTLGFDPDTGDLTPLQFLIALQNDKLDLIYRDEAKRKRTLEKGGIAISYRLEAAKTAAKYMHMEQPKITYSDTSETAFGEKLQKNISAGNQRIVRRQLIIEEVERINDHPVPPANYPPAMSPVIENEHINGSGGQLNGHSSVDDSAGQKGYNPDEDE